MSLLKEHDTLVQKNIHRQIYRYGVKIISPPPPPFPSVTVASPMTDGAAWLMYAKYLHLIRISHQEVSCVTPELRLADLIIQREKGAPTVSTY